MANYGEVVDALRAMEGKAVLLQMRSSAGGDYLTIRETLRTVELFADQAIDVEVGLAGRLTLHFDQFREAFVSEGGVWARYESGAVLRCRPDDAEAASSLIDD